MQTSGQRSEVAMRSTWLLHLCRYALLRHVYNRTCFPDGVTPHLVVPPYVTYNPAVERQLAWHVIIVIFVLQWLRPESRVSAGTGVVTQSTMTVANACC